MSPPPNSLLRPFYIFTYLSLAVSVVIFILSMLDLGYDSFLTNPCVSALTIIYHAVILILHRRASKSRESTPGSTSSLFPTSKVVSLVFAYILASVWLVAISMTAIAGPGLGYQNIIAENPGTVMAQLVLCVVEVLIMSAIAGLSTRMRVTYDRWAKNRPVFPVAPPSARSMSSLLRAFYILTYISLGSLTLIFTLSMLDLGSASLWTNPPMAGGTIIYHVVILVLQRHESRSQARALNNVPPQFRSHPTAKIASLVFAYLLACLWSLPIAFTVIAGGIYPDDLQNYQFAGVTLYAGNYRTVIVQLVLDVIELPLLFAIAAVSTRIRVLLEKWEKSQRATVFLPNIRPTTHNDNDNDDDKWSLNSSVKASSLKPTTIA